MSKTSLALTSLVAAVPAAGLLVILVLSFFSDPGFENMKGLLKFLAIAALLASAAVVLMPAGILVFGGRTAEAEEAAAGEASDEAAPGAASDDDLAAAGELDDGESSGGDEFEDEFAVDEEGASAPADADMFEADDEEFDDFDIEGFDDKKS